MCFSCLFFDAAASHRCLAPVLPPPLCFDTTAPFAAIVSACIGHCSRVQEGGTLSVIMCHWCCAPVLRIPAEFKRASEVVLSSTGRGLSLVQVSLLLLSCCFYPVVRCRTPNLRVVLQCPLSLPRASTPLFYLYPPPLPRRSSLSSLQTQVLFNLFDTNRDGALARCEFLDIMRERNTRGLTKARGDMWRQPTHEALVFS